MAMTSDRSSTAKGNRKRTSAGGTLADAGGWPHEFGFTTLPALPENAARRRGKISRWLGKNMLRILGWRVVGRYPDVPRLVIAGGPHTSFWDGIVGFSALLALGLDIRVLAKESLFVAPLGWLLRWLHAIPVNRRAPEGLVDQIVREFEQHDRLIVGASPEGTREKVETWRTGFYRIAEKAEVPILTVALDFGSKRVMAGPVIVPSGDMEADFRRMRTFMAQSEPKRPGKF